MTDTYIGTFKGVCLFVCLLVCVCVHKDIRSPGIGITGSCELPTSVLGTKLQSSERAEMVQQIKTLAAKPADLSSVDPQDPHSGRGELAHSSCPLTSSCYHG